MNGNASEKGPVPFTCGDDNCTICNPVKAPQPGPEPIVEAIIEGPTSIDLKKELEALFGPGVVEEELLDADIAQLKSPFDEQPAPITYGNMMFTRLPVVEGVEGPFSLLDEEYREYDYGNPETVYRVAFPIALYYKKGGSTHRIVDQLGVVHAVAYPVWNNRPVVLRWKAIDIGKTMSF